MSDNNNKEQSAFIINFSYDITNNHLGTALMKGDNIEQVRTRFLEQARILSNVEILEIEDTTSNEFLKKEADKEEARRQELEEWDKMMADMAPKTEDAEVIPFPNVETKDEDKVH